MVSSRNDRGKKERNEEHEKHLDEATYVNRPGTNTPDEVPTNNYECVHESGRDDVHVYIGLTTDSRKNPGGDNYGCEECENYELPYSMPRDGDVVEYKNMETRGYTNDIISTQTSDYQNLKTVTGRSKQIM